MFSSAIKYPYLSEKKRLLRAFPKKSALGNWHKKTRRWENFVSALKMKKAAFL
jgi:hypothetical protein